MYSDVFCKVYNEFGWNFYPEAFGQQLLDWIAEKGVSPQTSLDLACGTGVLCELLHSRGIQASGMDLSQGMIDIAKASCPDIHYDVADMVTYVPGEKFNLVTCTGDALNHISLLSDVEQIFRNVLSYLQPGGYFVFDILNEQEVSTSEPFEMDFSESIRVWFQMTRPGQKQVNLKIRVYENGEMRFEENIRETVHDVSVICDMLRRVGFSEVCYANRLLDRHNPSTTWFVIARKPQ